MNVLGQSNSNLHQGNTLVEGNLLVTGTINGDSSGVALTNDATGKTTTLTTQAVGDYTFDFPTTMGSAGQALVTDGSSNTSWVTISSVPGANDWNIGGNALTAAGSMGSTTAYDVDLVCNSNSFLKLDVNNDDIKLYRTLVSTAGARLGDNTALSLTGNSLITSLYASPSTTTGYSIYLPPAQGAADTQLKNDGAGALSWDEVDFLYPTSNTMVSKKNCTLQNTVSGVHSTYIGGQANARWSGGNYNTIVGSLAGNNITTGSENTLIGAYAFRLINAGARENVGIGFKAGEDCSGDRNVIIGNECAMDVGNVNDCIYIGQGVGGTSTLAGNNCCIIGGNGATTNAITDAYVTSLGSSTVCGDGSVAVGGLSNATGTESVSIGYASNAPRDNCVVIGGSASASSTGTNNTLLGDSTNVGGSLSNSTALGNAATASLSNQVTLGNGNVTEIRGMSNGLCNIGSATNQFLNAFTRGVSLYNSAGTFSTSINAGATSDWTLTLPVNAGSNNYVLTTDGAGNTSWTAKGGGSSPFSVDGSDNINGGSGNLSALAGGIQNQVIGVDSAQALTTGNNNTIIGRQTGNVITTGSSNILIGNGCETNKVDLAESVCVGYLGNIDNDYAIAIGSRPIASGDGCVAIGKNANASTAYAVAIGRESDSTSVSTVSIGNYSDSSGVNGVSVGNGATSVENSVSVGGVANSGVNGTAIGYSSLVIGGGTAVGYDSTSNSTGVAVGNSAGANDYSVAIGRSTTNSGSYSIAIGDGVTTSANQLKIGDATNTYKNFIYGGQIHKTDILTDSQPVNHRASKYLLHGYNSSQVFTLGTPENGYTATFFSYGGHTFQVYCGPTHQFKDGTGATTYRYANFPSAIGASLTVTFYGTIWYVSSVNNVTFS